MLFFNSHDNMHLVAPIRCMLSWKLTNCIESQQDLAHNADSEIEVVFDVYKLSDRRSLLGCR